VIRRLPPEAIVLAAAPLHLTLALGTDLSPDEAYYLCAARQPGLLPPLADHPPLLPWLLRLTDRVSALPVELRVRLWPLAFQLATGLAAVALARQRGAGREGCMLAAILAAFSLLPMAGGFVATPDGPALLAVALALLALGEAPPSPRRAALAAAALLLGAIAKVVMIPVALLLALTLPVRTALPLALAPLLALPLLAPSLAFQLRHAYARGAPEGWSLAGVIGAVAGAALAQMLLWSPPVFVRGLRRLGELPRPDRALVVGLSVLVLASAMIRAVPPEPNWWAPAALVVVVAFARSAADLAPWARRAILIAVLLPTAVAAAHTLRPFLPLPERVDPTARLHGWSRGREPLEAAGVGPYGPAAERCVYRARCDEIESYFRKMQVND
jgi:hypothetical protein